MNKEALLLKLEEAKTEADFPSAAEELVEHIEESGGSVEDVAVILGFMEANPKLDFGAPGALVHYVENYFGSGYEQQLVESIRRTPTIHTVWMLNRVINGVKDAALRENLIDVYREIRDRADLDMPTRKQVTHFLERLGAA